MLRDSDIINALELFIASGGTALFYYSREDSPKRVVDIKRADAWGSGVADSWDEAVKAAFVSWKDRYKIV